MQKNPNMFILSGELGTSLKSRGGLIKILGIRIKNKFLRSMKFKIILYILIIGIVPLLTFDLILLKVSEKHFISQRTQMIEQQSEILMNYILIENYLTENKSEGATDGFSKFMSVHYKRIVLIDKDFKILADTYSIDEGKIDISQNVIKAFDGEDTSQYNSETNYIEVVKGIKIENSNEIQGVLIVTYSTEDINKTINTVGNVSSLLKMIITLIVFFYAIYMAVRLVRPFKKVEDSIEMISGGYFDHEMSVKGYTETEQISEAFNQMLEKISKLEDSRQEFVSNVSHELKTPITSIKVLADSLLMQEEVSPELYREFLTDIVEEIDRENDIITDLLNLVKMDKTKADLNIEPVNINELLEVVLKRLRPLAVKRNIELVFESFRPVIAEVDETKLMLAASNLVENAIKYNVLDGWVHLSLNADHKYFYIKVADSGIGISEEEHEKVFDRFYRIDKTRARETGGTGLGLAITKSVILMHKGAIKVYSKEGEGTTFTVRIPLNYVN